MNKLHGFDLFLHVIELVSPETTAWAAEVKLSGDNAEEMVRKLIDHEKAKGIPWSICVHCRNPYPLIGEFCSADCREAAREAYKDDLRAMKEELRDILDA